MIKPAERATAATSKTPFVEFNFVRLQELNELVSKGNLLVVFLLLWYLSPAKAGSVLSGA